MKKLKCFFGMHDLKLYSYQNLNAYDCEDLEHYHYLNFNCIDCNKTKTTKGRGLMNDVKFSKLFFNSDENLAKHKE